VKAITPTPERLRHGYVRRATAIADASGSIGHPWHCRSLLDNILARGEITAHEHTAGCRFHELAVQAQIPPLRAADVMRPPGRATRNYLGSDAAQRQISAALDALGGLSAPMGSLAWDVLGCDDSLSDWSRRQRWTGKGRQTAAAKGVLLSCLPILALHFGLTRPAIAR